jgi:CRISPR/Cas system endoribonuclease Cas6 (RAMP superfamily)
MMNAVKVQRLHANESGLSRFDAFEIEREMTLFATPAQPFVSETGSCLFALCGEDGRREWNELRQFSQILGCGG